MIRYAFQKRMLDARYGQHKIGGTLKTLGPVTGVQQHERGMIVNTETARCV